MRHNLGGGGGGVLKTHFVVGGADLSHFLSSSNDIEHTVVVQDTMMPHIKF